MRDEARLTRNVAIQKKSTADSRSAVPFCTLTGKVTLLQRADARVQAGLVSRRGIFVDHALLNCFVQGGNRLSEHLLGRRFVAFGQGFAQIAQSATQTGTVGTVAFAAPNGLARAFQSRKMISHAES